MVIQQQSNVPIWGWAEPNSEINIYSSWNDKTVSAKSDASGKFTTNLETTVAGGPFQIEISSANKIVLKNVMLGEVWLCSGQSNMAMRLRGNMPKDSILNSSTEIENANFPNIRLFNVTKDYATSPLSNCEGQWKVCNSKNAAQFSAVAYFFAQNLNKSIDVPIGLIQSTYGGTPVESWMPVEYASKIERFKNTQKTLDNEKQNKIQYTKWLASMKMLDFTNYSYENMSAKLDSVLPSYHEENFDHSKWEQHKLPKSFEKQFGEIDALIWYRKEFIIQNNKTDKAYKLLLGAIDDSDETYINGVMVGKTTGWLLHREYIIPKGLLKEGKNTIAVRVLDRSGGGGIYKGNLCIKDENNVVVSLKGKWKYKMLGCFENPLAFRLFNDNFNLENRPKLALSPKSPTTLYNAMIAPLVPFKIKGTIWYQGENNVPHAEEYAKSFPLLIKAWRDIWNQEDFPFYYVQIAPHDYGSGKAPILREAQRLTTKLPNTGMVVTSDIGSLETIHPANKQDVGKRLALWALNKTYGKKDVVYSGPLYKSIITKGNRIRVNFDNVGSGLFCPDTTLTFFEIAGEDGKYYPAEAKIDGEQVVVRSSKVKQPVHVRFGWTDTAIPNLFNKEGLPAASFSSEMMGIEGNQISQTPIFFTKNLIEEIKPDSTVIYKTINNLELELHFFFPPNHQMTDEKPAIVFFHGGGWKNGKPAQFYMQCKYFASRGMVAMSAQYRTRKYNGTTPKECVKDGKSTMRWIRTQATQYGVNPNLLAAGGGSAGGHIAAATATLDGFNEEGEDTSVSCIPNALVLFNPVINNSSEGYGYDRVKDYWKEFSPHHNLQRGTPPTIFMVGTEDKLVKRNIAKQYKDKMEELGLRCDLIIYEGANHGFFNKKKNEEKHYQSLIDADRFLISLKYLEGKPETMNSLIDNE
jgi:sialate O-acetylesterase